MTKNWINEVPNDWQLLRLGSLFNLRNQKVSDKDYAPLSVSKGGVVPQMESVAKSDASDDRKLVLKGDFAINSRSDRKQSCGVSPSDGSVSLINTILYAKDNKIIYAPYLNYLLKNHGFAEEFYRWGHGIVADLWTTRWQEMKSILLPIPSYAEQIKLTKVLDKKINQIDELISNQEKQIEKLEEYKQSIITKAVTKGLDPNAKMKDSGVESIGLYPAHWKLMRAKFIAASIAKGSGITKEDVLESGNIDCVRYGEIYSKYSISFSKALSKTNIELIKDAQHIGYGDILCSGTGELVEEIGKNVVYLGHDDCLAGGDIIIVKHSQEPRFLNYALYCTASQLQKSKGKAKLKVVHISASNIGNINLVLPDSKEQKEIADYLDAKCNFVNSLIEIQKNKIEHLKEYKKSLIYEYVTGKKRVA